MEFIVVILYGIFEFILNRVGIKDIYSDSSAQNSSQLNRNFFGKKNVENC